MCGGVSGGVCGGVSVGVSVGVSGGVCAAVLCAAVCLTALRVSHCVYVLLRRSSFQTGGKNERRVSVKCVVAGENVATWRSAVEEEYPWVPGCVWSLWYRADPLIDPQVETRTQDQCLTVAISHCACL